MYLFKKKPIAFWIGLIDAFGNLFLARKKKDMPQGVKTICVIRVDHLGDVVFAEPFLRELRQGYPDSRIVFITSSVGREIYRSFRSLDQVIVFDPPWFHSQRRRGMIRGWWRLRKILKKINADAIVDLRGDFRHILAARVANPRAHLVSFGVTGGGFLLDQEVPYEAHHHAARRNLDFLKLLGIQHDLNNNLPSHRVASLPLEENLRSKLPNRRRFRVALHAGTGTKAKEWPVRHWVGLIKSLSTWEDTDFIWIGDEAAKQNVQNIVNAAEISGFTNFCAQLPASQLGSFLKMCDLLISADSGPVHIASSHNVKTLVLFSGTNEAKQWHPLGGFASVVSHPVPCSPCHERVCPLAKHECMEGILPDEVVKEARHILNGGLLTDNFEFINQTQIKVAVDVRMIAHPGIGRYIRMLLHAMLKEKSPYCFILVGPQESLQPFSAYSHVIIRNCNLGIYNLKGFFSMHRYFNDAELVHVPHFNIPFWTPRNLVVTIHDLIYFYFSEYRPFPGYVFVLKALFKRIARRAAGIIAVSRSTQRDCVKFFPEMKKKIRVIHEASDPLFEKQALTSNDVAERLGLKRDYILSVGSLREHKNIQGLIEAHERLGSQYKINVDLVLVGKLDPRFDEKVGFRKKAEASNIHWYENLGDDDLRGLYQGAACFVMPSFYEGFGLPVLEAMSCGAPVIASNTASLPEVVGEAGLLFSPHRIDDLTDLLYNVLSNSKLRNKLTLKGYQQAHNFSWKRAAKETLAAYNEVLHEKKRENKEKRIKVEDESRIFT